jgi:predicted short-subunit dehydrogenase-like oxidoreductase (DUF2520 family)
MVTEAQKQELRAAIDQVQDEVAFSKITAMVREALAQQRQRGKAGFLKGSVTYLADNWDAPLTDWKHLHE